MILLVEEKWQGFFFPCQVPSLIKTEQQQKKVSWSFFGDSKKTLKPKDQNFEDEESKESVRRKR